MHESPCHFIECRFSFSWKSFFFGFFLYSVADIVKFSPALVCTIWMT